MRSTFHILWGVLLFHIAWARAAQFQRQTIEVPLQPGSWWMSSFADIDGDRLLDLMVVGAGDPRLRIYRQQPSGFAAAPNQEIELPDQTAWITVMDVDRHPGLELVTSTAKGLFFLRQNQGVFESQFHALITAALAEEGADAVDRVGAPVDAPRFVIGCQPAPEVVVRCGLVA